MTPAAPPSAEAQAWAAHLAPGRPALAFALRPDRVLVADRVVDLVEGVWHRWPDQAHTLLRTRVHRVGPATALDRAVVQLCSRKLRDAVPTDRPGAIDERPVFDVMADARASRAEHASLSALPLRPRPADLGAHLEQRRAALPRHGRRAERARPVVALLYDADGTPLDAVRNTHGRHRLHHAEINLVQRWRARHGGPLPAGCEIAVSLQCCRMCAAALVEAASPEGLRVRYLDPEPGRFGRGTALQTLGWEAPL